MQGRLVTRGVRKVAFDPGGPGNVAIPRPNETAAQRGRCRRRASVLIAYDENERPRGVAARSFEFFFLKPT
jgi:hypothetical protein